MARTAALPATFATILVIAGFSVAQATTSSITDAFVAATTPAYEALRRADDLALAGTSSTRLRRFAERDSASQSAAAAGVIEWEGAEQRADIAAAHTPTIDGLGPILYPFDSVVFPLQVHGHVETDVYRATLAQLAGLNGTAFDPVYVAGQSSTLRRLVEVYTDYIKNGDDPGLRLLAVRNLPRIKALLAELHRL